LEETFGQFELPQTPEREVETEEERLIATFTDAIHEHRLVEVEYQKEGEQTWSKRLVEPYYLERQLPHWYVHTWDRTSDGERTFRLDRMRNAKLHDDRFEPRPGFDPHEFSRARAVRLGDRARDEEAQARAGLGLSGHARAAELLEDELLVLARDPGAVVADRDDEGAVLGRRGDLHLAARARVLDRVVDQVREHLAQPLAVAAHGRERPPHVRLHPDVVLAERRRRDRLLDEAREVDVAERVAERPRLDPRRVEDVRDERRQPARL